MSDTNPSTFSLDHHVKSAGEDHAKYDHTRHADGHSAHQEGMAFDKLLHPLVAALEADQEG